MGDEPSLGKERKQAAGLPPEEAKPASEQAQVWRQFAEYSGLAIAMPIATLIGYAAGRWLDGAIGTSFLWLAGLLLGIVAGFMQLIRKALKDSAKLSR